MSELTPAENKWLKKIQKVLNECPPTLGFYTIGDPSLSVYDRRKEDDINALMDSGQAGDFCIAVDELDALIGFLWFTAHVHSTSG